MAQEIFGPEFRQDSQEKQMEFQILNRERVFLSPHSFFSLSDVY